MHRRDQVWRFGPVIRVLCIDLDGTTCPSSPSGGDPPVTSFQTAKRSPITRRYSGPTERSGIAPHRICSERPPLGATIHVAKLAMEGSGSTTVAQSLTLKFSSARCSRISAQLCSSCFKRRLPQAVPRGLRLIHSERGWEQVKAGVKSRFRGTKADSPRRSPESRPVLRANC